MSLSGRYIDKLLNQRTITFEDIDTIQKYVSTLSDDQSGSDSELDVGHDLEQDVDQDLERDPEEAQTDPGSESADPEWTPHSEIKVLRILADTT